LRYLVLKKTRNLVLGFFLAFAFNFAHSDQNLLRKNQIREAADSHAWKRITDYASVEKLENPENFFLTDLIKFDPELELRETISRLHDADSESRKAFECRFPARTLFVHALLDAENDFDPLLCPRVSQQFGDLQAIPKISLLFVNGYFENPASFFGHVLLKIGGALPNSKAVLMESTLNYGANTANDKALPYVIKGLVGAYDASYQPGYLFRASALYQDLQGRDIWEYPLNLDDEQARMLLALIFEMLPRSYSYFFITDNCAYRLNTLLGSVLGQDPIERKFWSSPADLLFGLAKQEVLGAPKLHPSHRSKLISLLERLNSGELEQLRDLRKHGVRGAEEGYENRVLVTYLEELNFQKYKAFNKGKEDRVEEIENLRREALLALKPEGTKEVSPPLDPPTSSNLPTMLSYELAHSLAEDDQLFEVSFGLRGSNFGILENDSHRVSDSEFKFLSPEIGISKSRIRLKELTVFSVTALNSKRSIISGESSYAWSVKAGRFPLNVSCKLCSVNSLSGAVGKSFTLPGALTVSIMGEALIHADKYGLGNHSFSTNLLAIKKAVNHKLMFSFRKNYRKDGLEFSPEEFGFTSRWNFDQETAFQLEAKVSGSTTQISISLDRYF
jgi:hypothetical protein